MASWFKLLSRTPRTISRRPVARLRCESMEDRLNPATRFVVAANVFADNLSSFHTVAEALNTAGLAAGDIIQVEAGANPGSLSNVTLPSVGNLTIQGNPNLSTSDFGTLSLTTAISIDANRANLTFRNLEIQNLGGTLTINSQVIFDQAEFLDYTAGTAIQINGTANVTVLRTQFSNFDPTSTASTSPFLQISPNSGSFNIFLANSFYSYSAQTLIGYTSVATATVSDIFNQNAFYGLSGNASTGTSTGMFVLSSAVNNLTISNNRFIDLDGNFTSGLVISGGSSNITIINNEFLFSNATLSAGVTAGSALVINGDLANTTSVSIRNNQFDTNGNGTGLEINGSVGTLSILVEGNDFNNNRIGIDLSSTSSTSLSGVDLGNGALGSKGANNFRSFTTAANTTAGAIVVSGSASATIQAQGNLFSVVDPEVVITDNGDNAANGNVAVSFSLTGNAAYVQALYTEFLHRAGDVNNAGDAGYWINQLNSGVSAASVANSIIRSQESYGYIVDELYLSILGRQADLGGRNYWVSQLSSGVTLEVVKSQFYASAEYARLVGSDAAYVTSLYSQLLGRSVGTLDLNYWVGQIANVGRQSVALQILQSAEYRFYQVREFYSTILNRTTVPSDAEVNSWVNSNLDLLSIKVAFASSLEFQFNG